MKRKVIKIDNDKCNGCGLCVPNCAEGAIQIIDGKARLISDLFCDGLGACLGHCPEGAIEIEEREAEPYDERKTMEENIVPAGMNTIKTHLEHMRDHGETEYLNIALDYLKEKGISNPLEDDMAKPAAEKKGCGSHGGGGHQHGHGGGCPGSKMMNFGGKGSVKEEQKEGSVKSELQQWPVQLHLVSPVAPYFRNADVVLAADCVAFAMGNFHQDYLKGKGLAIACPKLDSNMEVYVDKLATMIDQAEINTLTVMRMEVPCCGGLMAIAQEALKKAERKVPVKEIMVSLRGEKISEKWV